MLKNSSQKVEDRLKYLQSIPLGSNDCNKKRFKSREDALEKMDLLNKRETKTENQKELKSVYKCPDCGHWHMTGLSKKKSRRIQRRTKSR